MALPGIDIATEIDLINQGQGQLVGDRRYAINGRIYAVKPNGAAYPESGEGIINVPPFAMALLRDMIKHQDNPDAVEQLIKTNPRYTDAVVQEASWLFARWKGETEDVGNWSPF